MMFVVALDVTMHDCGVVVVVRLVYVLREQHWRGEKCQSQHEMGGAMHQANHTRIMVALTSAVKPAVSGMLARLWLTAFVVNSAVNWKETT
ncbi:MAG TPA: hypothetical protein VM032_08455 [Vicinamibacterales bacterium]|nr:hypothetical protein [Vicinamibacterales bacterium]